MIALAQEMRERTDGADGCEKLVKNASLMDMKEAFTQLRRDEIWPGTLVTLFFSGHGAEHDGTHYLLPVGMPAAASLRELTQRAAAAEATAEALLAAKELCKQLDQGAEVASEVIRAQKRDLVEMVMTVETAKNPDMQIEQKEALRLELEGRSRPEHYAEHTFAGQSQGGLSVSWILQQLNDCLDVVTVLFLDCCRDNPQNETFKALGTSSTAVTKSFGDTDDGIVSDSQFFVGLACDPGTVA
eukprot:COSAG01_NODE_5146_length_4453_cov_10.678916_2_plen_243_part_00